MRYLRWMLSSAALVLGVLILAISFSTANNALGSTEADDSAQKQFYMGQTILPDHLAYPVLMGMDRIRLETETPQEQVYTQVEYAERRFEYTLGLIDKGNTTLALSTLTKSQKYLFHAAQEAMETSAPDSTKEYIVKALQYYKDQLPKIKAEFPSTDWNAIDQMLEQNQIITAQLLGSLDATTSGQTASPQDN